MYYIKQLDYHYYQEIADFLNEIKEKGFDFKAIISHGASGDNEKMHRIVFLMKDTTVTINNAG